MILFSLWRNLGAGMRLALFLPLRAFDYRVSAVNYAALVAFNFLVWVAAAVARAGFEGEFDESAVPVYLASVPLVLGTTMLVASAYREPERLLAVAVALTASDPLFELVGLALPFVDSLTGLGAAVYFVFFGWIWAVSLRAVAVAAGTRRRQLFQGALAVTAMLAIAFFLFPKTEVWRSPQVEEGPAALAEERLFHLQGELIEPGRPGVPELYFVGFAPDASQDVFLREMRFVKRMFDERFGTAKRSIALVSSYDALEEFPIGSATNLERSLKRVGAVMNRDEDILFLFISAHGDRQHQLSASQPPLELAALSPTALARMLQAAGIRWRVIVVSACYSGGYVEPLRDDNSIVITAAAPDRSSFGCETGRDFTYFGQAFFRDALAGARSFAEAFELAKALVSKQEAEEKLTPSAPQMAAGAAIAQQLNKLSYRPDKQ